ncbi:MAG: TlpA disulfide reductase family protein [Caldilineaceae bacterium]
MITRSYLLLTLISVLILSACGMPAAETMDHETMEQTETMGDDGAMADENMAESSMMTDTHVMSDTMMAGEMMTATHDMTDTMMTDDGMTDDGMAGEMDESDMMTATQTMSDTTSSGMEMDDTMSDAMMDLPVWQTLPLTDARTGATFTLADFTGKHVFVETMATWCTNCRQQLGNVKGAFTQAADAEIVFIAISVETDLAAATLAQYANSNDFGWAFAVATPDLVRALADTFGPTIANPPATPHFWIHPDGTHSDLVTGFESGDAILDQLAG